jgi:hypothetical protein
MPERAVAPGIIHKLPHTVRRGVHHSSPASFISPAGNEPGNEDQKHEGYRDDQQDKKCAFEKAAHDKYIQRIKGARSIIRPGRAIPQNK